MTRLGRTNTPQEFPTSDLSDTVAYPPVIDTERAAMPRRHPTAVPPIRAYTPDDVDMVVSPVNPAWIRSGSPVAREARCDSSRDGSTTTWVWDCTARVFDWYFPADETVHIIDGAVRVSAHGCPSRVLHPGDSAVFAAGTWALWEIPVYVRKHAVLRQHIPAPIRLAMRVHGRLTRRDPGSPPTLLPVAGEKVAQSFDGVDEITRPRQRHDPQMIRCRPVEPGALHDQDLLA